MKTLVEIEDNELRCAIDNGVGKANIRYTLVNDDWVRAKDQWQLFFTGIRPRLSKTVAISMLLSQRPEAALTLPLTDWLISQWYRESRANSARRRASEQRRNAHDHL